MVVRGGPAVLLAAILSVCVLAPSSAQTESTSGGGADASQTVESPVELAPRFALVTVSETNDPATRLIVDALRTAITDNVDAFFFDHSLSDDAERSVGIDISQPQVVQMVGREGWERYQAEIVIALSATIEDDEGEIAATFIQTSSGDAEAVILDERRVTVRVDNAGRYQREGNYQPIVDGVLQLVDSARPGREVVIRSNGPFVVEGLPPYVQTTSTGTATSTEPGTSTETEELVVTLRGLKTYEITLHRDGYRSETREFYLERRPITVDVPLKPYPRHSLAATMRGLSFPGIEYAYLPGSTRWIAHVGVTSFLFGLTPFRQLAHEGDPKLTTTYGLTELELGWQMLLRSRDVPHRFGLGAAATGRLVHGAGDFGFDPIIPGTLRLITSWEWELSGRFSVTQRLSSDLFMTWKQQFLEPFPWMYRVGPVYWQLPIYRVGLRVRL